MNLLFDFLKHLPAEEKEKLRSFHSRGVTQQVWNLMNEQTKGDLGKAAIQSALGISSAHFDKITSELLSKSYHHLFDDNGFALLEFLSMRVPYNKHFYTELNRQIKHAESEWSLQKRIPFYRKCFDFLLVNMPIASIDESVVQMLSKKYVSLFKGEEKKRADFLVQCKLLTSRIHKLFSAGDIKKHDQKINKAILALGKLPADADEYLTFEYYWMKIYFNHASENFPTGFAITKQAIPTLKKFTSPANKISLLRIELKSAELLYYNSRFDESFQDFEKIIHSPLMQTIPERGYYTTKFLQVCLITNHLETAGKILNAQLERFGNQLLQLITPRDIFSFIKYYLLIGNYPEAFRFLQIGFEKNPKGKYFQYEVELRNLQTCWFFLSGDQEEAIQMCSKHIKFLRAHGYGSRNSDFPHFYILTRAIYKQKSGLRKLSPAEQKMLERYQLGSFAVYGKLLMKMLEV